MISDRSSHIIKALLKSGDRRRYLLKKYFIENMNNDIEDNGEEDEDLGMADYFEIYESLESGLDDFLSMIEVMTESIRDRSERENLHNLFQVLESDYEIFLSSLKEYLALLDSVE